MVSMAVGNFKHREHQKLGYYIVVLGGHGGQRGSMVHVLMTSAAVGMIGNMISFLCMH